MNSCAWTTTTCFLFKIINCAWTTTTSPWGRSYILVVFQLMPCSHQNAPAPKGRRARASPISPWARPWSKTAQVRLSPAMPWQSVLHLRLQSRWASPISPWTIRCRNMPKYDLWYLGRLLKPKPSAETWSVVDDHYIFEIWIVGNGTPLHVHKTSKYIGSAYTNI